MAPLPAGPFCAYILAGVRDPDLSALPAELAERVRTLLARLKNEA